jgi:hypothetical protein
VHYRRIAVVFSLLVLVGSAGLRALNLEPLQGAAATVLWDGPQFIGADAHGEVFLLRGDTLQVYPITKKHDLGDPVQLDAGVRSGVPLDAEMNAEGNWLELLGGVPHLFVGTHERPLPALAPSPIAVGFVRDEPVAIVTPRHGDSPDDAPPLLLVPGTDAWSIELREPLHGSPIDYGRERAFRDGLMLDEREGRYLLARKYAYQIERRRLGRSAPIEELRLGTGEPILRKPLDGEEDKLRTQAKADGVDTAHGTLSVFRGSVALRALAQGGPQGRLYALVGPGVAGEHCALDRIDWDEHRVERVSLDLPCDGRVSLAAGRDGLYFAGFSGRGARFFASWASLETAKWTTVKEAAFNP